MLARGFEEAVACYQQTLATKQDAEEAALLDQRAANDEAGQRF
jgi:hypothetical protein